MSKAFEEHDTNVLAKEVFSDKEMSEFIGQKRASAKIQKKLREYDSLFARDPIVVKICKECGNAYSYPANNAWAQSKLGPDEGLCHECSGSYDDPEGFLKF